MSQTNAGTQGITEHLQRTVMEIAKQQLETTLHGTSVTLATNLETESLANDHWVSVILVSAHAVRMHFRVHFTSRDARQLLAIVLSNPTEAKTLDANIAHDVIREYCNMTAGAVKRWLLDASQDDARIGLPNEQPSYDQVDISKEKASAGPNAFEAWAFKFGACTLHCVSFIEVLDFAALQKITEMDVSSILVSNQADILFL